MKHFQLGSRIRFVGKFTDLTVSPSIPADPTSITLKLHDPTGTETSFTYGAGQVIKDSVGVYHFDYTPTMSGVSWRARWVGAGAVVAASEAMFEIVDSGFTVP